MKITLDINKQITWLIAEKQFVLDTIKDINPGDCVGMLRDQLNDLTQFEKCRQIDFFKIEKIISDFINDVSNEYHPAYDEDNVRLTDVTSDFLFFDSLRNELHIRAEYNLKDSRIILSLSFHGKDKYGNYGTMFLIGNHIYPFKSSSNKGSLK